MSIAIINGRDKDKVTAPWFQRLNNIDEKILNDIRYKLRKVACIQKLATSKKRQNARAKN